MIGGLIEDCDVGLVLPETIADDDAGEIEEMVTIEDLDNYAITKIVIGNE